MKKKVLVLLLCLVVVMVFGGALNNKLKKVDTNLEFWIAENVDKVDFSQYQEKYGIWTYYKFFT